MQWLGVRLELALLVLSLTPLLLYSSNDNCAAILLSVSLFNILVSELMESGKSLNITFGIIKKIS